MTAPASVVGQVTAALRERCLNDNWIIDTGHDWDDVRAAAKVAADAAWAAAYPAALRDAAGRFRFTDEDIENAVEAMQEGEWTWFQWLFRETLRRWADESETTATEESL